MRKLAPQICSFFAHFRAQTRASRSKLAALVYLGLRPRCGGYRPPKPPHFSFLRPVATLPPGCALASLVVSVASLLLSQFTLGTLRFARVPRERPRGVLEGGGLPPRTISGGNRLAENLQGAGFWLKRGDPYFDKNQLFCSKNGFVRGYP